ncbi:hypothetical protein KORDIASMS9_02601 [Kordia sp. SMS9]|uniref:hypothetical protein n=1 Tax=Kordia sp. SMS9 TaxID=2282170 RepID=UPI000E0D8E19|nr:hypothetical protein [Kordia sp. SMS9]AXG70362.1 hypothetical protein KORDIASMS9_02601 [Kordia sp. SMS9]
MGTIRKFTLGIMVFATLHLAAQETENIQMNDENAAIENFQLPSFSELSNSIATEYSQVRDRLPNLATIGEHVHKELRRGMLDMHSVSTAFRNLTPEHTILSDITPRRFQLRTTLNNIMFNGFDAFQAHSVGGWRVFGGQ